MKTKAIFFDLDETIFPSIDYYISGFKEVAWWLHRKGLIDYDKGFFCMLQIVTENGYLYKETFQKLCAQNDINYGFIPKMVEFFRSHYPNIVLYPDFMEFIESYWNEFIFGIITDGVQEVQQMKIKSLNLSRWFDNNKIILTNGLLPPTDKTSPEVFIQACALAGTKASDCLYIGDNPFKDFEQPYYLGWDTVRLVRGLYRNAETNVYIHKEIYSYRELYNYLSQIWDKGKKDKSL
jgi:putative hydrolase of the HAD superfamily